MVSLVLKPAPSFTLCSIFTIIDENGRAAKNVKGLGTLNM